MRQGVLKRCAQKISDRASRTLSICIASKYLYRCWIRAYYTIILIGGLLLYTACPTCAHVRI